MAGLALALARMGWDFLAPEFAALGALAGLLLGALWPRPLWSAAGLLIYSAVPVPLPGVALLGWALALAGWFWRAPWRSRWADVALGGVVLAALVVTLAPDVLPADAGEFQVVAATWGIAHAPGYPLYTLLAGMFAHGLPFETMAWRVNFFSAVTGAVTVALLGYTLRRETGHALGGWLAGLTLLGALTFWMTATQASIRPLTVFFMVAMLEAALAYRRALHNEQSIRPALVRFGLAAGLGVTHHGSLFFPGAALAIFVALAAPGRWRAWGWAFVGALGGALPWLYLFLRAEAYLAPEGLRTPDGFLDHVLARGFAGDMFAFAAPEHWPARWHVMQETFVLQWPGLVLPLAGLAWLAMLRQDRWLAGALGVPFVVHSIIVATYRAPQTVEYALPAYVFIAAAVGWLAATRRREAVGITISALAFFAIGPSVLTAWHSARAMGTWDDARAEARLILEQAPPDAVILANWHRATPLWYLQEAEGLRPDLRVDYVFPVGGETHLQTWARRMQAQAERGPALITPANREYYRYVDVSFQNEQIYAALPAQVPSSERIALGDGVALVPGFEQLTPTLHIGDAARLTVTWHLTRPVDFQEVTTYVHIGAPEAPPLAQLDQIIYAPRLAESGANVRLRYDVLLPYTLPPGEWTLFAGAYTPDGPLGERVPLGQVRVHPARFPMATGHPVWRNVAGARLLGWDYDNTLPDETRLYLHWHLRAADTTYQIDILDREGGVWALASARTAQHTGHWTSVHVLPPDIAGGGVRARLGDETFRILAARGDEHFIILGNAGALVDWGLDVHDDVIDTWLEWLPIGPSPLDVQFGYVLSGPGWRQATDFGPVQESIPAFKWGYGRHMRSQQSIQLAHAGPPDAVRLIWYDGFSAQAISPSNPRLSTDGPGVRLR